jgi:ubiquinone/menaquinone biosynthesis C-methylase UbiE
MTREYFNSMAVKWDELIAEKDLSKLDRLAAYLDITPASTVLDVGTGTGVFIPFLLKKVGAEGRLVCLDFAEEMLKKAKDKKFPGNITFVCADISVTGLNSHDFEAVVCYSSFPHFHDKPAALKEIYRLLKNNGVLYICHSSSRSAINGIHANINVLSHDLIPEKDVITQLMTDAGFKHIGIRDTAEMYLCRGLKTEMV